MAPKKKTSRRRRSGKTSPTPQLRLVLAALIVLVFLTVGLALIGLIRHGYAPPSAPPPVVSPQDPAPFTQPPLAAIQAEIQKQLSREGLSAEGIETIAEGQLPGWLVRGNRPTDEGLRQLQQQLQQVDAAVALKLEADSRTLIVDWQGRPCFLLRFAPPLQGPLAVRPGGPRLAIIMDDLGRDLGVARELLQIDLAITCSVLPGEPKAAAVAALAHEHGREVMIHIPMEPEAYPAVNPGTDALFLRLSPDQIRDRFRVYRQRVPFAVGGNNHMGSRFTTNRAGMITVLQIMQQAGLFFVDSRTSGSSVAFTEARRLGVPAAQRDVFLDNVAEVELIAVEIRRLAQLALRTGQAVGICHPYPQTLAALRQEAGMLRREGIEIVPVSELLEGN